MSEERIRDYILEGLIGRGGMGSVFLARHVHLGTKAALKLLLEQYSDDHAIKERFINEARLLGDLQHPNIVLQKEFFEENGRLVLVMEFVDGRGLDQMIGQEVGPIPWEKVLPLFVQILDGIGYAHSKGVIHRDIKPANILISREGRAKITDLGIAKIAGQKGMTRTGAQMGTLYYESPEQIRGAKEVDQRSDIYSLGMTLYEMLAGRLPFDTGGDTSEYAIMDSIVKRVEHLDPRLYYPHIPEWLVKTVQNATHLDPEKRFQNCGEFSQVVEKYGNHTQGESGFWTGKVASSAVASLNILKPISKGTPAPVSAEDRCPKCGAAVKEEMEFCGECGHNLRKQCPGCNGSIHWYRKFCPRCGVNIADKMAEIDAYQERKRIEKEAFLSLFPFQKIPSGSFMMGTPPGGFLEKGGSERPHHRVELSSFELLSTPVTQQMWQKVMGSNPAYGSGVGSSYPVYNVSWNDCQEFIDKLNSLDTEYEYRLPSESEWEYACRAGTATAYYWGDSMNGNYCWYDDNSGGATHPVAQKLPNAWGLYDMIGNVYEWCEDWYHDSYSGAPTNGSAWLSPSGSERVGRGGCWNSSAPYCRSAKRLSYVSGCSPILGLRLARTAR